VRFQSEAETAGKRGEKRRICSARRLVLGTRKRRERGKVWLLPPSSGPAFVAVSLVQQQRKYQGKGEEAINLWEVMS